jgi:hypothetical protein
MDKKTWGISKNETITSKNECPCLQAFCFLKCLMSFYACNTFSKYNRKIQEGIYEHKMAAWGNS